MLSLPKITVLFKMLKKKKLIINLNENIKKILQYFLMFIYTILV